MTPKVNHVSIASACAHSFAEYQVGIAFPAIGTGNTSVSRFTYTMTCAGASEHTHTHAHTVRFGDTSIDLSHAHALRHRQLVSVRRLFTTLWRRSPSCRRSIRHHTFESRRDASRVAVHMSAALLSMHVRALGVSRNRSRAFTCVQQNKRH